MDASHDQTAAILSAANMGCLDIYDLRIESFGDFEAIRHHCR